MRIRDEQKQVLLWHWDRSEARALSDRFKTNLAACLAFMQRRLETGGSGADCSVGFSGGKLGIRLRIRRRSPLWSPPWVKSAVTTGNPAFDALIVVKTSEPDQLRVALDNTTTRHILDLAFDGRLLVTDDRITFSEHVKNPTASMIVDTVRRLESLAKALERARTSKGHLA